MKRSLADLTQTVRLSLTPQANREALSQCDGFRSLSGWIWMSRVQNGRKNRAKSAHAAEELLREGTCLIEAETIYVGVLTQRLGEMGVLVERVDASENQSIR